MFGDEAVDPRRDNGQRYRAELEHSVVERAARNTSQSRSSYSSAAGTTAATTCEFMHHKRLMIRATISFRLAAPFGSAQGRLHQVAERRLLHEFPPLTRRGS